MAKQKDENAANLYFDQVRQVLNHFHDPEWLGENSPLAAPYFLGAALTDVPGANTALGRGQVLQKVIYQTANSLWGEPIPQSQKDLETAVQEARTAYGNKGNRYYFFLLELRYLRQIFRPTAYPQASSEQSIRDYLGVGRGPYFNHLKSARETLGNALLDFLQPTFRLEQPPQLLTPIVGRDTLIATCLQQLAQNQTVALIGAGGVGKTAVASALAAHWSASPIFWFTLRPSFNDQLNSLLFSLGYFLHQQGVSGLWLQLVANNGQIDNPQLALQQLRGDLHNLNPKPIICLDELEHLAASDEQITVAKHQFSIFIDGLLEQAPVLLIGQQTHLQAHHHHLLDGLTVAQTTQLLKQNEVPFTQAEAERMHHVMAGNSRLIWFCIDQYEQGKTLTELLDTFPETAVFHSLFARLWYTLSTEEQACLREISVFRSTIPADAFPQTATLVNTLIAKHLLQKDSQEAISLVPVIQQSIYNDRQRLPAEIREQAHIKAAMIRAERGEYTSAAYHFSQGNEPELAVQVWYPHRYQEIKRGQSTTALNIFQQLSQRRLPQPEAEALTLLRAELYQLTGQTEHGSREINSIDWDNTNETAVQANLLQANFLNALGQPHAAIEKLNQGLHSISRLIEQQIRYHQLRTLIHVQQWQLQDAIDTVGMAQYTATHLQGLIEEQQGHYDEAYMAYHQALAIARHHGNEAGMAQTNRDLANVLLRQSRLDEARLHLQATISYFDKIGDRLNWEKAHSTLIGIHFQAGEFDHVVEIGEKSLTFFEEANIPYYAGTIAANMSESFYELGNLEQAEFYAFKTLSFEETHPYPYALYTLGLIRRSQARFKEAESFLREAQVAAEGNEDGFMEAYALRLLGEILADEGKTAVAKETILQALTKFEQLQLTSEIKSTQQILDKL